MIDFDGRIELLATNHDRRSFVSGEPLLDDYLRRLARQHADAKISRTYMCIEGVEGDRILGYYSLAMSEIRLEQLPLAYRKRFPNDPVPVRRLARLAVDDSQQGKGLGKLLLMDAVPSPVGRNWFGRRRRRCEERTRAKLLQPDEL